jgi:RimJ/RimL family protein N-acetyltransferase
MHRAIETKRSRLEPVATGDVDAIAALLRLSDVGRYLCSDAEGARDVVAGWIADSVDPSSVTRYWRMEAGSQRIVGLIGLRPPMTGTLALRAIGWRSIELVVALDPTHWGKGLAAEAIDPIVAEGFSDGVTFAVLGVVSEPDTRAQRLMQRCGFTELGRIDGPMHRAVVYERSA